MAVPEQPSNVQAPKQERSRRTLEALLAVGEPLLAEKPFAEVTVSDIVKRANSSSGSFYARFSDKDAYLRELQQRFIDETLTMSKALSSEMQGPFPIADLAGIIVDSLIDTHRANAGVIRAARIESVRDASFVAPFGQLVTESAKNVVRLVDKNEFVGSPARQIEIGILTLLAMLDQELFHGTDTNTSASGRPKDVRARMQRVFLASMQLKASS